ncbi:MAG: hypothetical protein ACRCYP_04485, partial [Alphaproteobacteria bacterium]
MFRTIFEKIQENKKRKELHALRNDQQMHFHSVVSKYRKDRDEIYQQLIFWIDEFEEMVCLPYMQTWSDSDMELFTEIQHGILQGNTLNMFQSKMKPWSEKVEDLIKSEQCLEATQLLESERIAWKENADNLICEMEKLFSKY